MRLEHFAGDDSGFHAMSNSNLQHPNYYPHD